MNVSFTLNRKVVLENPDKTLLKNNRHFKQSINELLIRAYFDRQKAMDDSFCVDSRAHTSLSHHQGCKENLPCCGANGESRPDPVG